jgi:hypothetical protein
MSDPTQFKENDIVSPSTVLPLAVMVDIDGTLAMRGDRGPFNFESCSDDLPLAPVVKVVTALLRLDWKIVIVSGREEKFRDVTEEWLDRHLEAYHALCMRSNGDFRSDEIVKFEIFESYVRNTFDVQFVLDDRNRVVNMWRNKLGLTCFQVQDGDF